jgi:hypothetical protein
MWFGMVAAVVIAIVAGIVLESVGGSSADVFSTINTRL